MTLISGDMPPNMIVYLGRTHEFWSDIVNFIEPRLVVSSEKEKARMEEIVESIKKEILHDASTL